MKLDLQDIFEQFARYAAEEAHENLFHHRRGTISIGEDDVPLVVAFYDNNPFADDEALRPRIHADALRRLAATNVRPLATASYPGPGDEHPGYTVAYVFLPDHEDAVCDAFRTATDDAFGRSGPGDRAADGEASS